MLGLRKQHVMTKQSKGAQQYSETDNPLTTVTNIV